MTTLILLPGMDGTGTLLEPFRDLAGDRYDVEIVRYPPDEPLGYRELLPIARRAIPDSGDWVIIAESFSGPLSVLLAAEAPRPPEALVFCASFAANPMPPGFGLLKAPAHFAFRFTAPEAAARHFVSGWFAEDDDVQAAVASTRGVHPDVMSRRLEDILTFDTRDILRDLDVPVLYLQGTHDRLIGRRGLKTVVSARPDATVVELDGPHLLLLTRTGEVLAEIDRFLG